jgi:hypothetical protein
LRDTFSPFWSGKVNSGALSLICMDISPSRSSLYRSTARLVLLFAIVFALVQGTSAQTPYGAKPYKGPRALGLIELPAKGKPHFIPIAILVNGTFYDASAYKADPVPMALWSETVYEGLRTGVSQGLFTVTNALENPKTNEWIAEGTWQSAESLAKKVEKKPESSIPRGMEDDSGPPVLRHSGEKKPAPPQPAPSLTSPTPDTAKPASPPPAAPSQQQGPAPAAAQTPVSTASAPPSIEDQNIPVLRRGRPTAAPPEPETPPASSAKASSKPPAAAAPPKPPAVQLIAAISDAGGPEPRPYSYELKGDDEQQFRKKMLAMAAEEIAARAKQLASESGSSQPAHAPARRTGARNARPPQPDFQDVQLRVFDLSSSNEPVLVLTANAEMPKSAANAQTTLADLQYSIALVAREDINGDFHKAFSEVTDAQHLDVLPRYELIDAVDADGDGRGELLFRQISDEGSTFAIYRVIGDQLYPLFQSAP